MTVPGTRPFAALSRRPIAWTGWPRRANRASRRLANVTSTSIIRDQIPPTPKLGR